jgi:hypothetical protein
MTPTGVFQPEQSAELSDSWGRMSETREFIIENKKGDQFTVLLDEADYVQFVENDRYKWWIRKVSTRPWVDSAYVMGTDKHAKKEVALHRVMLDAPKGMVVDHINRNGLDNRRSNLRLCTHRENMQNRRANSNNLTGYKGVRLTKSGKKYIARHCQKIDGKTVEHYLGTYDTPEEAARAYDAKAIELFGEYANLNFPEEHNRKESK